MNFPRVGFLDLCIGDRCIAFQWRLRRGLLAIRAVAGWAVVNMGIGIVGVCKKASAYGLFRLHPWGLRKEVG